MRRHLAGSVFLVLLVSGAALAFSSSLALGLTVCLGIIFAMACFLP
jgi:hypothetical protein